MNSSSFLLLLQFFLFNYTSGKIKPIEEKKETKIWDHIDKIFPRGETVIVWNFHEGFEDVLNEVLENLEGRPIVILKDLEHSGHTTTQQNFLVILKEAKHNFLEVVKNSKFWNPSSSPRGHYLILLWDEPPVQEMNELVEILTKEDITKFGILLKEVPIENRTPNFNSTFLVSLYTNFMPLVSNATSLKPGVALKTIRVIGKHLGIKLAFAEDDFTNEYIIRGETKLQEEAIYSRKYDAIAAIPHRMRAYVDKFDISDVIFYDDYVWAMARAPQLSNIKVLAKIFQSWTLGLILMAFVLVGIIWFALEEKNDEKRGLSWYFLSTAAMALGISLKSTPNAAKLRLLFIIFLVYSMHLIACFQGNLSSVLTTPIYEKGLSGIEELAESEVTPFIYKSLIGDLTKINTSTTRRLVGKARTRGLMIGVEILDFVLSHPDMAVDLYKSKLDLYPNYKQKIHVISEALLMNLESVIVVRKGHPFLGRFNELIQRIREGGLPKFWLESMQFVTFETQDKMVVLTLDHIKGAYYFLGVGYCLGVVVFLGEILSGVTFRK